MNRKIIRCAVYTRKSSEEGLEQDFNSLDAQREAGEAYIKSQKHEGWELLPDKYDDGGYSGGNMERPALRKLMTDIEAGKIDTIVVYKVDRLSRALSDFAKMVEVFDKYNVSFVSVTQQFNTTTSMGRLTLNVLLSFAQFEREVTGERIRDKFAASKKKGIWMGGIPPLGYEVKDRKLHVVPEEAKIVKYIFNYMITRDEGRTLPKLLDELKTLDYKTKEIKYITGRKIGGNDFRLNHIYHMVKNPIYAGKLHHKKELYEGEHAAIISEELWQLAQSKINGFKKEKLNQVKTEQPKLIGKIFDYLGNKMTASYSYKYSKNGRYKMRYYVNREIYNKGKTDSELKRIRADYLDKFIGQELCKIIEDKLSKLAKSNNSDLISSNLGILKELEYRPFDSINKIILFPKHIELQLNIIENLIVNLSVQYKRLSEKLIINNSNNLIEIQMSDLEKYSHNPEDKTFTLIAKGFYWSNLVKNRKYKTAAEIAEVCNVNITYVKRAMWQRYLSPKWLNIIISNKTIIQRPHSINSLMEISWRWDMQNFKT